MKLRGIDFGSVIVSMTETLTLSGDDRPRKRRVVRFGAGVVLSDGRASKEGLAAALGKLAVEKKNETKPFFLAFKPMLATTDERIDEMRKAVVVLQDAKGSFPVTFALAIDMTGIPLGEDEAARSVYKEEAKELLAAAASLGAPLVLMVSILLAPEDASDIMLDPNADALLLSDSVAWGDLPERAQKVFFRTKVSPLASVGGGVVRGKYLLPLAVEWVGQLKRRFIAKPIITAAGVLRPGDVNALKEAGVSAVALDAVRILRPWNIGRIIKRAKILAEK